MKSIWNGSFKMNNILQIWRLRAASVVSSLLIVLLLTDEGGRRQFALVHAVDRAEGAHDATYSEAVEHLPRLDQCFACMAARKFAVCLQQRETGTFRLYTDHCWEQDGNRMHFY